MTGKWAGTHSHCFAPHATYFQQAICLSQGSEGPLIKPLSYVVSWPGPWEVALKRLHPASSPSTITYQNAISARTEEGLFATKSSGDMESSVGKIKPGSKVGCVVQTLAQPLILGGECFLST